MLAARRPMLRSRVEGFGLRLPVGQTAPTTSVFKRDGHELGFLKNCRHINRRSPKCATGDRLFDQPLFSQLLQRISKARLS